MNLSFIDMAIKSYGDKIDEADKARLDLFHSLWAAANESVVGLDLGYEAPSAEDALVALKAVDDGADSASSKKAPRNGAVFEAVPVSIDGAVLASTMSALVNVLKENGSFGEAADALAELDWAATFETLALSLAGSKPAEFLLALADGLMGANASSGASENTDGLSEVSVGLAVSMASLALRVQLEGPAEAAVKAIGQREMEQGRFMTCPVCGSEPMVARVGGENATKGRGKVLGCLQCGTSWDFDRIRCARCGDQNSGHLHYFNIEGDDAHRINICDTCGGYMRTLFLDDALAPCSFDVEDVLMAKLDAVATNPSIAKGSERIPQ